VSGIVAGNPVFLQNGRMNEIMGAKEKRNIRVPEAFIYEVWDGKPLYYQGYREAMANNQPAESVMGTGRKQVYLINLLLRFLHRTLDLSVHETAVSEPGVKFGKKDSVSNDIIIYNAADKSRMFTNEYFDFPPVIAVEVDTKAALGDLSWQHDYYYRKTERLLEFGIEKVIWIFTELRKIQVAEKGKPWIVVDWQDTVDVLPGCSLNLWKLIESDGVAVEEVFPKEV
jgi:hypothetical protein